MEMKNCNENKLFEDKIQYKIPLGTCDLLQPTVAYCNLL